MAWSKAIDSYALSWGSFRKEARNLIKTAQRKSQDRSPRIRCFVYTCYGNPQMKKVIDKNYAQDPGLEEYLRADANNKVVLTDYFSMEMYNGNAIKNVYKSHQILSRYPQQVICLKCTSPATKIGNISNDPQECLEDREQTREFSRFCYGVHLAAQGDRDLAAQILRYGELASQHLASIPKNPVEYAQAINDIRRSFDAEELAV